MPELPEVETVVRGLSGLAGDAIENVEVRWPRSIESPVHEFKKAIEGQKVEKVFRRGKFICIGLQGGTCFTVHLRMTGKLVFSPEAKDMPYARVCFNLRGLGKLHFIDVRKFGKMKLWPAGMPFLPDLGPEPLEVQVVGEALRKLQTKRPIKSVLLDQTVLAGVGNIYADEALHMSGVHPLIPASLLRPAQREKLGQAIPLILLRSIENRGTTLSDYRTTDNTKGGNQSRLAVYGREGEPCNACGALIVRQVIGGRSSHFCAKCQKAPRKKTKI